MIRRPSLVCSALLAIVGCSRPSTSAEGTIVTPPAQPSAPSSAAPPASASSSSAPAPSAAPAPAAAASVSPRGYPVGPECSTPEAIAREKRSLPPLADWKTVTSAKQRVRLRVPRGVFEATDAADGLRLVSSQKAKTLGPGKDRPFSLRVVRLARSIDDLLADESKASPLGWVDDAFPRRDARSFTPKDEDRMGSGSAARATVAGKAAYVWVVGVEGYNTDYTLVELGPKDTLLVVADWNSSVMQGQPECWQRAIIGGVVDSIVVEG